MQVSPKTDVEKPVAATVIVLGTGGTIAGTAASASDNLAYAAGSVGVERLLEGISPAAGTTLVSEQVAQIDSKDMEFATWRALAERCTAWLARDEVTGLVVTHGTDTLEETAYFLHAVLAPVKPIVLTCAMRPASSQAADGPQNLSDAIAVASSPGAGGVLVVCAGGVHDAQGVQKVHPYRLDAFDSGDAGPVGFVEEGVLRRVREWPATSAPDPVPVRWPQSAGAWPRVEIVLNHVGASGRLVDGLVEDGVDGIVAAGTGNGTLHHALEAALLRASSAGVRVVRTSRCAYGRVLPHAGDVLPEAQGLSPVKARIRLLLDLLR